MRLQAQTASQIVFCKPVANKPLTWFSFICLSYGRWKPILEPGHLPLCNPSIKEEAKTHTHPCPTAASIFTTLSKFLWNHVFLNSQNSMIPYPLSAGFTTYPRNPRRHLRAYCHYTRAVPIWFPQLLLFHRLCYCLPVRPKRTLGSDSKKL